MDALRQRRADIVEGWLRATLGAYPGGAVSFYENEKDPFANPVGASVRASIGPLFDALLADTPPSGYAADLDRIIRVRCVQDMPPSQAVWFVFLLKGVVRDALGASAGAAASGDLAAFEARIDRMAACAFDIYAGYARKIADIRVREMKDSVAALLRMSRIAGGAGSECAEQEAGDR
jgi:hypothetical protein